MYAVIGEDRSDTETLACLIRRIKNNNGLKVRQQPNSGCGELFRKGPDQIKLFYNAFDCRNFIICYDSDGENADYRRQRILSDLIRRSGVHGKYCALVPVQEIESWFLADLSAVQRVITGFRPSAPHPSPENQASPKEHLERITRASGSRPRYNHAVHNQHIAKYVDLAKVEEKCPSFKPLLDFVRHGTCNVSI